VQDQRREDEVVHPLHPAGDLRRVPVVRVHLGEHDQTDPLRLRGEVE
jgi:hypothetical protein